MSTIGLIPGCCRSCVAWELEAAAARNAMAVGEAEFEKEIWLSGVMLTWGSAGQIVTVDDAPVGFALYAPPTAVPGATAFPTAPVSPDAVLLTTARIEPTHRRQGLARYLMEGVIRELTRRGVRAIELFGREDDADPEAAIDSLLGQAAGTVAARGEHPAVGEDDIPPCVLPAGFARAVGFTEVKPHHRFPRLRLELGRDIGWKAEVEAALEELFASVSIPASPPPAVRELVGAGTNRTSST
jgi:GNAT superfamily N-acetyltransferase